MAESCDLIRDLIPLVKGRNASGESVRRVEGHLADCDACAEYYEACSPDKEKRSIRLVLFFLGLLTAGALVFLSQWILKGFWSYFFLMVSGAFTYFAFRRGRWILPLGVFVAANIYQLFALWQSYGELALGVFISNLSGMFVHFILFPAILAIGGMAAAFLFRFALHPRHKGENLPAILKWSASIDRSSLPLRTAAGVAALSIAAAGLLWINSVYGNPVSSLIAENAMRTYLSKRYGNYSLTYENTWYRLDGNYYADVSSPTDPDLSFTLTYYSDGKISDTYLDRVTSGGNAFERLQGELDKKLTSILKTKYGSSLMWVSTLPLDNVRMLREKVLGGLTSFGTAESPCFAVDIMMNLSTFTPETAAAKITQCYKALKENGYVFRQYGITTYQNGGEASRITPEDIESGNLISLLTAAMLDKNGDSRICYREPSDIPY